MHKQLFDLKLGQKFRFTNEKGIYKVCKKYNDFVYGNYEMPHCKVVNTKTKQERIFNFLNPTVEVIE